MSAFLLGARAGKILPLRVVNRRLVMFGLTERRARSNIEDFYGQLGILREQLEELAAPVTWQQKPRRRRKKQ